MKAFMDQDFLLNTETAKKLYQAAEECPIIDYHCHLNPREIWEDVRYENITRVWLGGDHYKWRLMRCAGVPEEYITGSASDHDKFIKWAEVLGKAAGNPLYHWSHLELQRYFDYYGLLNAETAEEVWQLTLAKLADPSFSARGLIARSNVEVICTTDNPIDDLKYHEMIKAEGKMQTKVLPAWRPDNAMNMAADTYQEYIGRLADAAGMEINSFTDLRTALSKRMDFFADHGCCLSDHGIVSVPCADWTEEEVDLIFRRRMTGLKPTVEEQEKFDTAFLFFMAGEYTRRGWTMQLHYGTRRNNNKTMFDRLGPDTGYDCIEAGAANQKTAAFLGLLEMKGVLPKTILYSLNPGDNQAIDTICGCFRSTKEGVGIQHGSAWWFNDHFVGMTDQLTSLGNLGYLAGFVGMLTDSRSFLSYPRHEYFRRILCRLLGQWVEDGMFPADWDRLNEIVKDISYGNAKRFFGFDRQ